MDRIQPYTFRPIGVLHTPFSQKNETPRQSALAGPVAGTIEVFQAYDEGLADLDGFSHLFVVWVSHAARGKPLRVRPYFDTVEHGVFATRCPERPNPIGLSVVRLLRIRGKFLDIDHVDMLDETPVLDLKPYVPRFDSWPADRIGWFEGKLP